jgi:hypothetical protein
MTSPRPGEQGRQLSEAQLGGADAVQKTTYVEGSGTDPQARSPIGVPTATTPARGPSVVMWLLVVVIVLLAVVYLGGVFR